MPAPGADAAWPGSPSVQSTSRCASLKPPSSVRARGRPGRATTASRARSSADGAGAATACAPGGSSASAVDAATVLAGVSLTLGADPRAPSVGATAGVAAIDEALSRPGARPRPRPHRPTPRRGRPAHRSSTTSRRLPTLPSSLGVRLPARTRRAERRPGRDAVPPTLGDAVAHDGESRASARARPRPPRRRASRAPAVRARRDASAEPIERGDRARATRRRAPVATTVAPTPSRAMNRRDPLGPRPARPCVATQCSTAARRRGSRPLRRSDDVGYFSLNARMRSSYCAASRA